MTDAATFDVYVVDVCGTLVHDDTTLGLLRHHFAKDGKRPIRNILFKAFTAPRSPLMLAFAVLEKLSGRHLLKLVAVRMLAGDKVVALNQSGTEYAAWLLKNRRVASVQALLDIPVQSGRVLLASASLEPVVASLALALGARYVASTLEQRAGVLTGRYTSDLTGKKEQALIEKYGSALLSGNICAISDNFSDRSLLEKASQAYVVLHRQSHLKRWHGLNATFLKVDK